MRGLSKATLELIFFAKSLLAQFHPMTLRQLHYAIFSVKKIEYDNTQKDYKRLSRATTGARRSYRAWELGYGEEKEATIDSAWIVDETREARTVTCWDDLSDYLSTVRWGWR